MYEKKNNKILITTDKQKVNKIEYLSTNKKENERVNKESESDSISKKEIKEVTFVKLVGTEKLIKIIPTLI